MAPKRKRDVPETEEERFQKLRKRSSNELRERAERTVENYKKQKKLVEDYKQEINESDDLEYEIGREIEVKTEAGSNSGGSSGSHAACEGPGQTYTQDPPSDADLPDENYIIGSSTMYSPPRDYSVQPEKDYKVGCSSQLESELEGEMRKQTNYTDKMKKAKEEAKDLKVKLDMYNRAILAKGGDPVYVTSDVTSDDDSDN